MMYQSWYPISSAPQDGTPIEIKCPDGGFVFEGPSASSTYEVMEMAPSLIVAYRGIDVFAREKVWQLYWSHQDGNYNYYPYILNPEQWRPYYFNHES